MRALFRHQDYRIQMDLPKFTEVGSRSLGHGHIEARSVTWIRVCVARLLRHKPGVTPVRAFRDIRQDMGM